MLNKTEIYRCKTTMDSQGEFDYKYLLLECSKMINIKNAEVSVPCYGIEIVRESSDNGKLKTCSEMVECISSEKTKVLALINYFGKNVVSPIHLVELAGTFADEWVVDFETSGSYLLKAQ